MTSLIGSPRVYMFNRPSDDQSTKYRLAWFSLMVFDATFNNISVLSWRSVVLVEKTGENHRLVESHWQIYHIMLHTSPWSKFELTTSVVIGTDCIGNKSNYHTITPTTGPMYRTIKIEYIWYQLKTIHKQCISSRLIIPLRCSLMFIYKNTILDNQSAFGLIPYTFIYCISN